MVFKSPTKKYLEKWERVKRHYGELLRVESGVIEESDDQCRDIVYSFFGECFALKDWVRNNSEDLFDKNKGKECFKVCADFANKQKHLILTKHIRGDANTDLIKQGVTVVIGGPIGGRFQPTTGKYNWKIEWSAKEYDVYELAKECFQEWETYLQNNLLL